ncbi:MAG: hypothetical protein Kow0092_34150 [Deferrisomatales bacterium]
MGSLLRSRTLPFLAVLAALAAITGTLSWVGWSRSRMFLARDAVRLHLVRAERDHYRWTTTLMREVIEGKKTLSVEKDPTRCGFGRWYGSPERARELRLVPEVAGMLALLEEPHRKLHAQIGRLEDLLAQGRTQEAILHYRRNVEPSARFLLEAFGEIRKHALGGAEQERRRLRDWSATQNRVVLAGLGTALGGIAVALLALRRLRGRSRPRAGHALHI